RTVESLAAEAGASMANASQHLQTLREAGLVEGRKEGLYVHYRLADPVVLDLTRALRLVAERRLADLERLVRGHFANRASEPEPVSLDELVARARRKRIVLVDARPVAEYASGHIPGAISVPVDELHPRLRELPKG